MIKIKVVNLKELNNFVVDKLLIEIIYSRKIIFEFFYI